MPARFLMRTLALTGILFASFIAALGQGPPAVAAKPTITAEKRALITELLEVTETRKNALAVFNSMIEFEQNQASDLILESLNRDRGPGELNDAAKDELRKKMVENSSRTNKRVQELFDKRIDFPQVVEDVFIELYDKYFTEAELKDLVAFYRSSTGRKSIAVQPQMFAESMTSTMERIKPAVLEIMTEFSKGEAERLKKELEADSAKLPKPRRTRPSRKRS